VASLQRGSISATIEPIFIDTCIFLFELKVETPIVLYKTKGKTLSL
jgi:hypothetical protein